jgi:hypothetical protein
LRNEYKSFFAMIVSYIVLEILGDVFAKHKLELDSFWLIILSVSSIFFIVTMIVKIKTRVLDVEGR